MSYELPNSVTRQAAGAGLKSGKEQWLAAGGIFAALLASTCCIGPLALLMLGVSGAWIGNLTALEPYNPYFAGAALVFIGLGFRLVYFKKRSACDATAHCAKPQSAVVVKSALWLSSALVILALTIRWWAPFLY